MSEQIKNGIVLIGLCFAFAIILIAAKIIDERDEKIITLNSTIDSLTLVNDILVSPRPLITEAFHLKCYWLLKDETEND